MSSSHPELVINWCNHDAAKYAIEHWHYSANLPYGRKVTIGAWEREDFIGAVVFAWGANKNIAAPYGLEQGEVVELVRVALGRHTTPTTKIVAAAIKMLKHQSPGIRLLVSYADTEQNHLGTIYQAGNWVYVGLRETSPWHFVRGRWMKQRMASQILGTVVGTQRRPGGAKHKYLYPMDGAMRRKIADLAQPYPKREECESS